MEVMNAFVSMIVVFLGGGIGAVLRYSTILASNRLLGNAFPFGTLIVNVLGSLIMGVIAAFLVAKALQSEAWRLFLTVGLLGGFTTFSAFSYDFFALMERKEILHAMQYMAGSIIISILALMLGYSLGKAVL